MRASDFIKVLRKIIREEVREVVREEIKALKPMITENSTQLTNKRITTTQQRPKRQHVKDGSLSTMLRETAESMRSNPATDYDDWPSMGGLMTSEQVNPSMGHQPTNNHFQESHNDLPASMPVKNYANILKAAEQISQDKYRG